MSASAPSPLQPRGREVLTRLALAEADALRLLISQPRELRGWWAAEELVGRDPELAAATVVVLASMVSTREPSAEALVAWLDEPDRRER